MKNNSKTLDMCYIMKAENEQERSIMFCLLEKVRIIEGPYISFTIFNN